MDFKDYYKILGVAPEAEAAEIKAAYRKLARKYHPDVSEHAEAEQRFKEVAEAWQVLKDSDKRAEYDQLKAWHQQQGQKASGFQPPPGWQHARAEDGYGSSGFSDFFEQIFGARSAGSGSGGFQRPHFNLRGSDIEMELPVFLEELLSGESRNVAYRVPRFDDAGRVVGDTEKSLKVRLPQGVSDGETIRLKGQGAAGIGQGPAGDLYLRIRLVPHPLFDVEGNHLLLTVPLAPWEAALGTKVTVPTLSGEIQLTIPVNSQSGRKLRIKGKGLPGRTGLGDLFAVLKVVMPPEADAKSRELWRSLQQEHASFDARAEWRKQP